MFTFTSKNRESLNNMNSQRDKISLVKKAILEANENSSLKDIVDSAESSFEGIRMLISTDSTGAQLQVDGSLRHIMSGIFSKSRLLAYSDSIRKEMETGTAIIGFKQRALLDTNFLSDLPKYFKGIDISTKENVQDILNAIEDSYDGGFDYCFPMLENLRQFTSENNPYPVNKVSAAIYLDHKLRGIMKKPSNGDIFEPYFREAETLWLNFRSNKQMWELVDKRDLIYAVMLKTYHLCWTNDNITIESALYELVDYCIHRLGVLPLKELYFSWKIIIGHSIGCYTPVFDERSLRAPRKDSVRRLSALSWDLFIFRFSETLLTEETGNCFYIPSITTLDQGLLDTISSCPVKAMISFPKLNYVETIFEDELQFQQCLNSSLSSKQKAMISDSKRNIKGEINMRHYISMSISDLEKSIKKLT